MSDAPTPAGTSSPGPAPPPRGRIKRHFSTATRLRQVWGFRLAALRYRALRSLGLAPPPVDLALCLCFKNAASYLAEWIEFHRLVGVAHFYLYDNDSGDDFAAFLAPYLAEGLVTLHHWPGPRMQVPAYDHCLRAYGPRARWIAFIDDDEFLFPVQGDSLPEVLRDYEDHAGVLVTRVLFGSSGHATRPAGGVLENFVRCASAAHPNLAKTVVRPPRAIGFRNPHAILPRPGHHVVDENFLNCSEGNRSMSRNPTSLRLRVNHYECKSDEELLAKMARGDAFKGGQQIYDEKSRRTRRLKFANEIENRDIQRFLPALREALRHRTHASPPAS